jgi:transcriptional regulator with XRE-family HTH domain
MAVHTTFSLKELRARKNKTQKQVASDLGVSVTTYCAWENDISNVAVSKVQAVANYYGVAIGQISFSPIHENNSCT